jgi:integrase
MTVDCFPEHMVTPAKFAAYQKLPAAASAAKTLRDPTGATSKEAGKARDHLMLCLLVTNGSRAGVLINMTMKEFADASVRDRRVIVNVSSFKSSSHLPARSPPKCPGQGLETVREYSSVTPVFFSKFQVQNHKTEQAGFAPLGFSETFHQYACAYREHLRPIVGAEAIRTDKFFINSRGGGMSNSYFNRCVSNIWRRAGWPEEHEGKGQPRFSATLMRKSLVTDVSTRLRTLQSCWTGHKNKASPELSHLVTVPGLS